MINAFDIAYTNHLNEIDDIINSLLNDNCADMLGYDIISIIQEIYGFDLKNFKLRTFIIPSINSKSINGPYYVLIGPFKDIEPIRYTMRKNGLENRIIGKYPDGILLGFFADEYREDNFKEKHAYEYAFDIHRICRSYMFDREDISPLMYSYFSENIITAYRLMTDLKVIINQQYDLPDKFDEFLKYSMEHSKDFIDIYKQYDYISMCKYIVTMKKELERGNK